MHTGVDWSFFVRRGFEWCCFVKALQQSLFDPHAPQASWNTSVFTAVEIVVAPFMLKLLCSLQVKGLAGAESQKRSALQNKPRQCLSLFSVLLCLCRSFVPQQPLNFMLLWSAHCLRADRHTSRRLAYGMRSVSITSVNRLICSHKCFLKRGRAVLYPRE